MSSEFWYSGSWLGSDAPILRKKELRTRKAFVMRLRAHYSDHCQGAVT